MLYLAVVTFYLGNFLRAHWEFSQGCGPFSRGYTSPCLRNSFISPFHPPQESRGSQLRDANHLRCDPVQVDVYFLHEVL